MKKILLCIYLFIPFLSYCQEKDDDAPQKTIAELSKLLDTEFRNLKTAEDRKDKQGIAHSEGNIGGLYINVAKRQSSEDVVPTSLIAAEKKTNLKKSIDYSNKAITTAGEIGDMDQLRASYKNLAVAQKMSGNIKGQMASYAKLATLKKTIFTGKKTSEIEKKQLEYEHARREDSIHRQQQLAEERVKEQNQRLAQQQRQLDATSENLTTAQKEKQVVNATLQKTQYDLNVEKNAVEEKDKQLTLAEKERALQAANLQLQQSKLQLQQNELKLKDQVLGQQKRERYFYIAGIGALLAFSFFAFQSFRTQKKSNLALTKEKKRSEELLLNILPAEVAEELMEKGFADAKHFYDVTVLFTDFVSFTSVAETMSPQQLVGELHICFKAFDHILGKYHIEKIKTVGDAYMAVSGLPVSNPNHAADVAAAAIEIRDFMAKRKEQLGSGTFSIRIGINSGEVVAGIVGVRKFSYDIWGDTVNIAARMEQNCEEGKINISDTTYQLVKDKYACIYRGKIQAKNKGGIDMYYLA